MAKTSESAHRSTIAHHLWRTKRTVEILIRIFLSIPTIVVLSEIFLFGWQPKVGFFSQFYNPRMLCSTTRIPDKVNGFHYMYVMELKIAKPLVEHIPLSPIKVHNVNLYSYPDTSITKVDTPTEVAPTAFRYSLGDRDNSKRSIDFSYRFIDVEYITFDLTIATNTNLGPKECALNVSYY